MMMNEGLSAGDILALTRDRDDDRRRNRDICCQFNGCNGCRF